MYEDYKPTSLTDALYSRSSVRSYNADPIDEALLSALLAAAIRAPTAIHQEPWRFVIVQDKQRLQRLSERARSLTSPEAEQLHAHKGMGAAHSFAEPGFDIFYGATTLIVICADPSLPFVDADCWMAAENLMLTAQALGLGTCVIGSAVSALNEQLFKDELGIPEDCIAIAPIIVGHPATHSPPSWRKAPAIVSRR